MRSAALVLALTLAACAPGYTGGARPVAKAQVRPTEGWTVVASEGAVAEVKQVSETDCGAAALAMIVARWRPDLNRSQIARRVPDGGAGLRLGDLRTVARAAGLKAYALAGERTDLEHELGMGRAVLIGLHRPYGARKKLAHYEVVVGMHRDGRVATIDPADAGWHVRSWASLLAEWQPAGNAMLVVLGKR